MWKNIKDVCTDERGTALRNMCRVSYFSKRKHISIQINMLWEVVGLREISGFFSLLCFLVFLQ